MPFVFRGKISSSKSLMNRALTIKSYSPEIQLLGASQSDDVTLMSQSLHAFEKGQTEFDCGHAGTVLRFLALRVSRRPGEYLLKASPRLLSRPQGGLYKILDQLKVSYQVTTHGLVIKSAGWQGFDIKVDGKESSQFLSSLFLNSWDLPQDLTVAVGTELVSEGYFTLTENLVKKFGLKIKSLNDKTWMIAKKQIPQNQSYNVEPDMSSCFAVAAAATLAGECVIENFPQESLQPDHIFCRILTSLGGHWLIEENQLLVKKAQALKPIELNVSNCPDVVPVLSVLLALAQGVSRITGFSHLVYKESNRLAKVQELLTLLGRQWEIVNDEFLIYGRVEEFSCSSDYDPDQDHRMAMAAQVACLRGAKFHILHKDVVNKSFPEFWQIMGVL